MAIARTIDVAQGTTAYTEGTGRAGAKLVRKFNAVSGIVAAATSDAAITLFKTKVTSDLAIKKRTFKLNKVGDAGLHAAMTARGGSNYTTKTAQVATKWAAGFAPFAQPLQTIVQGLAPRTDDPATNVTNRVLPIAVGMKAAAKALYGAA